VNADDHTSEQSRTHTHTGHGRWPFLRHYLEMVAAMLVGMLVGMLVLGTAVRGVLTLAGLEFPSRPEADVLEMAFYMSAGMVVWMRHRGHGRPATLEMTAAMIVPALALFPPLWLGLISGDSLMLLEHVVMLPLMWALMLRRRDEYGA
jgi:flagellar biosynthetic protein FliP